MASIADAPSGDVLDTVHTSLCAHEEANLPGSTSWRWEGPLNPRDHLFRFLEV